MGWKLQRMLLSESTENLLLEMPEGLDHLRMTSFTAETSIPSREQPILNRTEKGKEAKANLLLGNLLLNPNIRMLSKALVRVLLRVLYPELGVFLVALDAKSR